MEVASMAKISMKSGRTVFTVRLLKKGANINGKNDSG